jgi:hypothetical protein
MNAPGRILPVIALSIAIGGTIISLRYGLRLSNARWSWQSGVLGIFTGAGLYLIDKLFAARRKR